MDAPTIRPLQTDAEAAACAAFMAASDPWLTLKRGEDALLPMLRDPRRERYVAMVGDRLAGCLVLNLQGPFAGYLQAICAAPGFRGQGLGAAMVAFAEARVFREHPNLFLCVSSFNPGARRLYERLGYAAVGELTDYLVPGHSEWLLRKTLGPILGFLGEPEPDGPPSNPGGTR